ncbi:uncharacterized protein IL334_002862 [Kwoniella shivajii]|uniref:Chromatin structure-remodeling complex subunit SFH1 n=1 Tax=Kwoniella shivajii TaxID=564305 RepID=A0ABZ1CWA3_9TREE|nr:hypothetical protein IL334_002862 [Kwoniella shivajii]
MPSHAGFSFPPPGWPSNTYRPPNKPSSSTSIPSSSTVIHGHVSHVHPQYPPPPLNVYMNPQPSHTQYHNQPPQFIPPQYPTPFNAHSHPQPSPNIYPPFAPSYSHTPQMKPSFTPGPHQHPHPQQPTPTYIPVPGPSTYRLPYSPAHPPRQPPTAYHPPNYRPTYNHASTPTRPSNTYPSSYSNQSRQSQQVNGMVPRPQQPYPQVYYHPSSYPPGVLPYFKPPPGQKTIDPSLSTPPTSQAIYTTYPSRLRTGITSLVQPEHITGGPREREAFYAEQERELLAAQRAGSITGTSTPRYDSPIPGSTSTSTLKRNNNSQSNLSGRRGGRINYAEQASDDDDEEEDESDLSDLEEPPSDPEDDSYGSRRRPGGRSSSRRDHSLIVGGYEHQIAMKAGKAKRKREEMDRGWTWLGDRTPAERVKSANAKLTKHAYMSEELLEKEADRPEMLVPITVDLDIPNPDPNGQGIRIKDRFLWNINEPFIDPIQFAQIFCDDLSIPQSYAATISELIKGQLEESQNTVEIDITNEDVTEDDVLFSDEEVEDQMELDVGEANEDDAMALNGTTEKIAENDAEKEAAVEEEEQEEEEKEKVWEEADCRIIVNLDVQIYTHILRDRIEWDLSSNLPPSVFAKQYCSELGLTGEAIPLITWAIHEELLKHKKDALELDLFSSTHPEEQAKFDRTGVPPRTNSKRGGTKGLIGVWRDWWEREEFSPILVELSFDEIISREQERMREGRRMMRTIAGGKRRR